MSQKEKKMVTKERELQQWSLIALENKRAACVFYFRVAIRLRVAPNPMCRAAATHQQQGTQGSVATTYIVNVGNEDSNNDTGCDSIGDGNSDSRTSICASVAVPCCAAVVAAALCWFRSA